MEVFLEQYEDEERLTEYNEKFTPNIEKPKEIHYDKDLRQFKVNHNTSLMAYIKTLTPNNCPGWVNFTFSRFTYFVSYNFLYKLIFVYMGKDYNDENLDWFYSQIPKLQGFRVFKNDKGSSFRVYNRMHEQLVISNILKFVSYYPLEFKNLMSIYILKSFNFSPLRLNSPERLSALHKNIALFNFGHTVRKSKDGKYMVVFKHFNPAPELFTNLTLQDYLVRVYDWNGEIIKIIETPNYVLPRLSGVDFYILEPNYSMDFEACYNWLLELLTELYFQSAPLNNNSPSSE